MLVNDSATPTEVEYAFARYEAALVGHDVEVMEALFWQDTRVLRSGITENLHGAAETLASRQPWPSKGLARTTVTTLGTDFSTASTLFYRDRAPGRVGRQMQPWAHLAQGWHVVAAHVSIIVEADQIPARRGRSLPASGWGPLAVCCDLRT